MPKGNEKIDFSNANKSLVAQATIARDVAIPTTYTNEDCPRILYIEEAGDLVITDWLGNQRTYTDVSKERIFQFIPKSIDEGTTATVVAWN